MEYNNNNTIISSWRDACISSFLHLFHPLGPTTRVLLLMFFLLRRRKKNFHHFQLFNSTQWTATCSTNDDVSTNRFLVSAVRVARCFCPKPYGSTKNFSRRCWPCLHESNSIWLMYKPFDIFYGPHTDTNTHPWLAEVSEDWEAARPR